MRIVNNTGNKISKYKIETVKPDAKMEQAEIKESILAGLV